MLGQSPGMVGRTNAKRVPTTETKLVIEEGDSLSNPSKSRSNVSTSNQVDGMPRIPRIKNIWKYVESVRVRMLCAYCLVS